MIGWPSYGELSVCGRLHDIVADGPNAAGDRWHDAGQAPITAINQRFNAMHS
jgi:hypothetical protein